MKNSIILTLIGVSLFISPTHAQTVSDRTNTLQMDFTRPSVTTVLPTITWELPALEYTSSTENRINIKATVVSSVELKRVGVAVTRSLTGEPVYREIEFDSKVIANVEKNVYLRDGQNYIQVIAENIDGAIVTDYRSVIVGMNALKDAIAMDRKDYAILFATDQYDNWNDLVNPIYDANAIAKELAERYGFEVKVVENANQDKVLTTLREYAQISYKPQDQLMVFFAGHGQFDDVFGEGYVVARDSRANDPSKNSYISHNRLRNNINNIPCDHIALVMDVCFGGTFDPVLASSRNIYDEIDNTEYIAKKLSTKTRKFLTSGSKEYVSDGVRGSHSPFTVRFLEALKSNGGEDRLLTFSEVNLSMQKLKTTPRYGSFGDDEAGSEFLFITR
jgi:Caspase domain